MIVMSAARDCAYSIFPCMGCKQAVEYPARRQQQLKIVNMGFTKSRQDQLHPTRFRQLTLVHVQIVHQFSDPLQGLDVQIEAVKQDIDTVAQRTAPML